MDRAAARRQLERIVSSPCFGSAESLSRLLRYVVEHSIEHPNEPLKEHRIATEVFGRPPDFDPRLDAIVRVQISRLRTRIAKYYAGSGSEDDLIIDIPKKSHIAVIQHRPLPPARQPDTDEHVLPASRSVWSALRFPLLLAAIGFVVLAAGYSSRSQSGRARSADSAGLEPALVEFWSPMLRSTTPPMMVYSNAEFVGHPESGMRYFDPAKDRPATVLDHYTGIGEVFAAVELSRVLGRLGREMRLKRGRLLTLDDLKTNNVIFAGSPAENLVLRDVEVTRDFVFERQSEGPRKGHIAIVNRRPRQGEPARLLASASIPMVEDYALIGMSQALERDRWTLVLAGTTTLGTQAAAEFVCRAADLEKLLARLPAGKRNSFEAVIRVSVAKGVPVRSDIVAIHPM